MATYNAIGNAGVYYGFKSARHIEWVFRDEPFPRVPNCDGQAGQNSPMVSWLPFQYGPSPSTVLGRGAHALWRAALGHETQLK